MFVGPLGQSSIIAATRTAEVNSSMGGDMDSWMSQGNSAGRKRVLVVEDELMIRMLLQDMLDDLGHTRAGEAGRIDEAMRLAKQADFAGRRSIGAARAAVRVRDRVRPARRAGTLSPDADAAKAVSSRRAGAGTGGRSPAPAELVVLIQRPNRTTLRAWSNKAHRSYRAATASRKCSALPAPRCRFRSRAA